MRYLKGIQKVGVRTKKKAKRTRNASTTYYPERKRPCQGRRWYLKGGGGSDGAKSLCSNQFCQLANITDREKSYDCFQVVHHQVTIMILLKTGTWLFIWRVFRGSSELYNKDGCLNVKFMKIVMVDGRVIDLFKVNIFSFNLYVMCGSNSCGF